jgi:hypothetical protein
MAFLQAPVQHVERKARAVGRLGAAAKRDLVATSHRVDAEALLDLCEILVELSEEFRDQAVVVEGDDDMRRVGGGRRYRGARRQCTASG